MTKTLSVIIPCRNEERFIGDCLESVAVSEFPKEQLEVIVVDGMSTDRTRKIVLAYSELYPFIRLLDNPLLTAQFAFNIGVRASETPFITVISAHASYPPDYFSKLVEWHGKLDADYLGGVCLTDVKNKTKVSRAIREVLSSPFGVGNSAFRTGISEVKEADTVAFGCYRREAFAKYGLFNEKLVRNMDIEFSKRILKNGGKIFIVPEISCTYYARETYHGLARNNFANGKWNILTMLYSGSFQSISIRHMIPLYFLLSLVIPLIFSVFWWPLALVSVLSLAAYLILLSVVSLKLSSKEVSLFHIILAFIVLHLSYGTGSLVGVFKTISK
jgi:glycosyltransferase involved in cell wall biosynthesis